MVEVVVSQFSFSSATTYYGIHFFFAILIFLIVGLISLSASNHISASFMKSNLEGAGWGFVLLSVFVALGAVLFVPQLVDNASRKAEVVNAQDIARKLISESGYDQITINDAKYINNYLLNGDMSCDSSAYNKKSSALGLNEKRVVVEQMTLTFTVDENNRTCSYALISENE